MSAAQPPTDPPQRPARRRAPSLVLVNTGDGKGKSTAAFGVVLRAVARGWKVCVIQFLKSGRWRTGEEELGRRLGVDWNPLGDGFTWDSEDLEATEAKAAAAWAAARRVLASGDYQLVVLDEVTYPMNWGWIDPAEVAAAIRDRPPGPVAADALGHLGVAGLAGDDHGDRAVPAAGQSRGQGRLAAAGAAEQQGERHQ